MILKISSPNNLTSLNQIIHSYVFMLRKVILALISMNFIRRTLKKIAQDILHILICSSEKCSMY
jgi:hypothetical protein